MIDLSKLKKTDYVILAVLLTLMIRIVFAVLHGTNQSNADTLSAEGEKRDITSSSTNPLFLISSNQRNFVTEFVNNADNYKKRSKILLFLLNEFYQFCCGFVAVSMLS